MDEGGNNSMMMEDVDEWMGKIIEPNKCLIGGVEVTMALPRQWQWNVVSDKELPEREQQSKTETAHQEEFNYASFVQKEHEQKRA